MTATHSFTFVCVCCDIRRALFVGGIAFSVGVLASGIGHCLHSHDACFVLTRRLPSTVPRQAEEHARQRIAALGRDGAKWFELISSIDMEGWVFCHTIEYRTHQP